MNALLLAITVTLVVFLDYLWDGLPERYKKRKKLKWAFVLSLLAFAWLQAAIQYTRDRQSDKDVEILKHQSSKPTFQLFMSSFTNQSTTDRFETNLLTRTVTHNIQIQRAASLEGLSPGKVVDLKDSREIALSVFVYGDVPADKLSIDLATPWVDQRNIAGGTGWQTATHAVDLFETTTHTLNKALRMRLQIAQLVPPKEFVRLPILRVPTNYPSKSIPIRFTIYANNALSQEVGVVFTAK